MSNFFINQEQDVINPERVIMTWSHRIPEERKIPPYLRVGKLYMEEDKIFFEYLRDEENFKDAIEKGFF